MRRGNLEDESFLEKIRNRKYRKNIILLFYFIIFIFLIILLNIMPNKKLEEKDNKKEVSEKETEKKTERDERFNLLFSKNYNFNFVFTYNALSRVYSGKRFNNKYDFVITSGDEKTTVLGTEGLIKINGKDIVSVFPYYVINYFDVDLLEKIVSNSNRVEDVYEINNETLNNILKIDHNIINPEGLNKIKLVTKNNYITEIIIDYTEYAKEHDPEVKKVNISLKYLNFNLIDDFEI